jgi:small subunit ribosomal protein S16
LDLYALLSAGAEKGGSALTEDEASNKWCRPKYFLWRTIMVRIRLKRMGRKKKPFYRVVAADSRAPRDGRHIEVLGYYDPMTEPMTINLKMERVQYWLSVGASPSDTVASLIKRAQNSASDSSAE